MFGENSYNMPVGLAMSFSTNPEAFKRFLEMSDSEQNEIMARARKIKAPRELEALVDKIRVQNIDKM